MDCHLELTPTVLPLYHLLWVGGAVIFVAEIFDRVKP